MSAIGCGSVRVFSTCPPSTSLPREDYLRRVVDVAQWSERAGCEGILVYSDNSLVDPWGLSQFILAKTNSIAPLVAVQPIYMHPYTTAKLVATCAHIYSRRLFLNMIAGGFRNDLKALDDETPHDSRYERLTEYTLVVRRLLEESDAIRFEGKYYTVNNVKMSPPVPAEMVPGILSSGSSAAAMQAACAMGSTPVKYPRPPGEEEDFRENHPDGAGIRVGVIARPSVEEAWRVARERFPDDRRGRLTHQLAMKASDSVWHKQLSARRPGEREEPYWLGPFQTYRTFCPYLVGAYAEVAALLRGYLQRGCHTVILDVPVSPEELEHTATVFRMALDGDDQR